MYRCRVVSSPQAHWSACSRVLLCSYVSMASLSDPVDTARPTRPAVRTPHGERVRRGPIPTWCPSMIGCRPNGAIEPFWPVAAPDLTAPTTVGGAARVRHGAATTFPCAYETDFWACGWPLVARGLLGLSARMRSGRLCLAHTKRFTFFPYFPLLPRSIPFTPVHRHRRHLLVPLPASSLLLPPHPRHHPTAPETARWGCSAPAAAPSPPP